MSRCMLPVLLILALLLGACQTRPNSQTRSPANQPTPSMPAETDISQTATAMPTAAPTEEQPALLPQPLYATNALGYRLWSAEETEIGPLSELIVDSLSGRWLYLVVNGALAPDLPSGSYPVPLSAVQLQAFPSNPQELAFRLQVPASELADAPTLEETFIEGEVGEDIDPLTWDADILRFWTQHVDLPRLSGSTPRGVPLQVTSSPLTGLRLPLAAGDEVIATVVDFIFSPQGGVQYALLGAESGLGLESGQIPVPWNVLLWNAALERFDLDVDPVVFEQAPLFPTGVQRPDLAQAGWETQLSNYWQQAAGLQQVAEVEPLPQDLPTRAAQLLGNMLVDENGTALGPIEDLTLDLRGQAEYVIVNLDGRHVPVPMTATGLHPQSGSLVYRGGPGLLNAAPGYRSLEDIPLSYTAGWDGAMRTHWSSLLHNPDAGGEQEDSLPAAPLRASSIFNRQVVDARGRTLGVVADLVLTTSGGHSFVVLDTDLRLVPIPWRYFRWNDADRMLSYTAAADELPRAPAFDSIPQLEPALPTWETPILEFWG